MPACLLSAGGTTKSVLDFTTVVIDCYLQSQCSILKQTSKEARNPALAATRESDLLFRLDRVIAFAGLHSVILVADSQIHFVIGAVFFRIGWRVGDHVL